MPKLGDIDPAELEREGRRVFDWIAGYFRSIREREVYPRVDPDQISRFLQAPIPEQGEELAVIFEDFRDRIVPYLTHWNHPGFLAYFANTGSAPGILAETLAAAVNVNVMLWRTAPAAAALEEVVLNWMKELMGYPRESDGIIVGGASLASLWAMRASLEEIPGLEIRKRGLAGRSIPTLRVYVSEEAHSSLERAALTLGLGSDNVVHVPTDSRFRLRPETFEEAVESDRSKGRLPVFACATVGTTSTTSIDPLAEMAAICRRHGIWLHVDAAYGGAAALLPEMTDRLGDFSLGDSLVVNPHKWLFTPMETSVLLCRRRDVLRKTFSLVPDYLEPAPEGGADFMELTPQLGRGFRALKLWYVLRTYGRSGLQSRIREHLRLSSWFAAQVDEHPDFERVAPVPLSVVCFRARGRDPERLNQLLLESVNASGKVFLSHTRLRGEPALRLAIGNIRTDFEDVELAWELLCRELRRLRAEEE